jgi:tRNA modification GTPase
LAAELTAIVQLLADQQQAAAATALGRLLDRADLGLHLTQPWQVVVAGAPNAGKSSLVNAILGYQRAIVWPEPGTTRDVLTASTAIDGWPVELTDTAGLRAAGEPIEAAGVARAQQQIAAADLVLVIADTTAPWNDDLYRQVSRGRNSRTLVIAHNKCDLLAPPADGRPAGIAISAKTGTGIDELLAAVSRAIVPQPPLPGAAVPFTNEQVAAIHTANAHLSRGDARAASGALTALLQRPAPSRSAYNDRCEK